MPLRLTTNLGGNSQSWPLETSPMILGRSSKAAIQLADPTVSKEHAEITREREIWRVRDLGSRNGTRVNGREAEAATQIREGDTLEVGHVVLRVTGEHAVTPFGPSTGLDSSLKIRVTDVLQRQRAGGGDSGRVMQVLADAGRLLVLPGPLRETCEELLRFVEKAVPTSRLVLLLRETDGAEPVQIAARYRGGSSREPLALSQTIMQMVLNENTAVITRDAATDPRFMQQHSIVAQAIHSAMAVPLFDDERVLGLLYDDSTDLMTTYGQKELELLTLLGNMAAVKITNARLLEAEQSRQRMAQELATATRIQDDLLPEPPTNIAGWTCHARVEACWEVGGDLYDFHLREDGTLVVLVGDVSGKGMGAALLMSSILSTSRVLYDDCEDPLALVKRLNSVVSRSTDSRSFCTLFVGYLDPATGRLLYVNAGHPEPHLVLGDRVRTLEATGIPVAMLPKFEWKMGETVIEPGEVVAMFTDGIPEAQRGEAFFDFERIVEALRATSSESDLDRVSDGLIERIDAFAAGEHRADDVTLVLLRRS